MMQLYTEECFPWHFSLIIYFWFNVTLNSRRSDLFYKYDGSNVQLYMFEDGFFVFTDWIVKHADHDQTVQVHGAIFMQLLTIQYQLVPV